MGKLNVVCGNILDFLDNKDLVVNSANKYMTYGSGVCGVIYRRASKDLLGNYCKQHFHINMEVNEVRFTPGFDLGIDILHIYCPKYYESDAPLNDLLQSYDKIFSLSKVKNYKSVVSVSLGTGVHGYRHNDIGVQVIKKLRGLVSEYDIDFTLVLPNEDIKKLYI